VSVEQQQVVLAVELKAQNPPRRRLVAALAVGNVLECSFDNPAAPERPFVETVVLDAGARECCR
jgi:hypothetical protein